MIFLQYDSIMTAAVAKHIGKLGSIQDRKTPGTYMNSISLLKNPKAKAMITHHLVAHFLPAPNLNSCG
jgi:hypothetical protein